MFIAQGYQVDTEKGALGEEELISRLVKGNYSAVGIRSKTKVTAKVIESVKNVSALVLVVSQACAYKSIPAHRHRMLLHRYESS